MGFGARIATHAGKRSNRQIIRDANAAIKQSTRVWMIALAILAEKGGEITVTQKTINDVGSRLHELDFDIVGGINPGEFIVRLLEGKTDGAEETDHGAHCEAGDACNHEGAGTGDHQHATGEAPGHPHEVDIQRLADDGGPVDDQHAD